MSRRGGGRSRNIRGAGRRRNLRAGVRRRRELLARSGESFSLTGTQDSRVFGDDAIGGLREVSGGRRRSWRRRDGTFRFRQQTYEGRELLIGSEDGVHDTFWEALQNTLDAARDQEGGQAFEPDTEVRFTFVSPNGIESSTAYTPLQGSTVEDMCDTLLIKILGSDPDLTIDKVIISYVRGAQGAGGGDRERDRERGVKHLGAKSRITVYSHGSEDVACGPRSIVMLLASKNKENDPVYWELIRNSHAKKVTSAAARIRQAAAETLCVEAGVDINTLTSFPDLIKFISVLSARLDKSCGI